MRAIQLRTNVNLWRVPNENGGALEKDEVDEDGLSVATLDQRVDKTVCQCLVHENHVVLCHE